MILKIYLASLGLVWVLKDSYIFLTPREYLKSKSKHLKEFLSCSLCLGFWVGLFFSITINPIHLYDQHLINAFSVSAFCWFFDSLLDLIQYKCLSIKNSNET